MNFNAVDILSVIRNEHDEDQHQRSISRICIYAIRVKVFQQSQLIRNQKRLAVRDFLENLVYSHEFKGVMRSTTLVLGGNLLDVASDGFVLYQINRTLATLGRDFADWHIGDFKLISQVAIVCKSPTDVSRLMSFALSSINFSFDRERRYLAEVNQ